MHWAREVFDDFFKFRYGDLGMELVYDVAHNVAKLEKHMIDGEEKEVYVHRKGATRAFPAGHPEIPEDYMDVGQPVIIPGSMGTASYVLKGCPAAMELTFGSACHGAGRVHSRKKAKKIGAGKDLFAEMHKMGVTVQAKGRGTVAEEMPYAYKDVANVAEVMDKAGISKKPETAAPKTAPKVLMAYSVPTERPTICGERVKKLDSTGKVAPMKVAGTSRIKPLNRNLIILKM